MSHHVVKHDNNVDLQESIEVWYYLIGGPNGPNFNGHIPPSSSRCDGCLLKKEELKRCSKCKVVKYCSTVCQTEAWKNYHKSMCNTVKVAPVEEMGMGVIAMRNISKGEKVIVEAPIIQMSITPTLDAIKTNLKLLSSLPSKKKRKLMSLSDPSPPTNNGALKVAAKLAVNAIKAPKNENRGLVYFALARLNHSCVPNVRQVKNVNGGKDWAIALKDIENGEELCKDYIEGFSQYTKCSERKEQLRSMFLIPDCICKACSLPTERIIQSDKNRLELEALTNELNVLRDPAELKVVQKITDKMLKLLEEEGLDTAINLMEIYHKLVKASVGNFKDMARYTQELIKLSSTSY